jgi:alkylation response protein AidB-like acyl-CoA dehydrogenase
MTAAETTRTSSGPAQVASIAEVVLAEAAASEAARTTTQPIVDAMWASGLMTHMNPAEAGGDEPTFTDMIETWIDMAALDGSFGWIGIANLPSAAATAALLPDDGFAEVFGGADHHVTLGGQFFPNGQGVATDGGVRLTGAWNFGSGTGHSQYVAAGFLSIVDGEMVWLAPGVPDMRVAIIPRDEIVFTDGWHVQGLKGTGSFDYNVRDVFVPERRTYPLFSRDVQRGASAPLHMGLMPITAAGHAGWVLGVAKSMLDDVEHLATTKVRMGDMATFANRPTFQRGYTHHRAMWKAARLLVIDTFATIEAAVSSGDELTPAMRADMRAAAVYATDASRAVGEWAHLASGTTAIREGSRLERAFRDLYTGTQHAFISEKVAIDAAQVHLGIVEDQRGL